MTRKDWAREKAGALFQSVYDRVDNNGEIVESDKHTAIEDIADALKAERARARRVVREWANDWEVDDAKRDELLRRLKGV